MKRINFFTSKGEFVLMDLPLDVIFVSKDGLVRFDDDILYTPIFHEKLEFISKLSEITEQQVSDIVDLFTEYSKMYQDYERPACGYDTAIDSLHSLIKSKGVYLYENPYTKLVDENYSKGNRILFEQAEQNTFYNPYLFKRYE